MFTNLDTSSASRRFNKGAKWLEKQVRLLTNAKRQKVELAEKEEELRIVSEDLIVARAQQRRLAVRHDLIDREIGLSYRIEELKARSKLKYRCSDCDSV